MTTIARNVQSYRDVEIDREVVAVELGHDHYLVLVAGGVSRCEVRRYPLGRLIVNDRSSLRGAVSLHRLRHLTRQLTRRADAGAEAVFRGVLDPQWDKTKSVSTQSPKSLLHVDEEFMDALRQRDDSFTANVEAALRAAIANVGGNEQARAYAHGMIEALDTFGLEGVRLNVAYLVLNLRTWRGPQAARAKQTLNKWANK